MSLIVLSPRVEVSASDGVSWARLTTRVDGSVMQFQLDASPPRLHLGVLLAHRERPVDVSTRPAVVMAAIGNASPEALHDATAIADWLASFCGEHGLWAAHDGDLTRGFTGAAFPLLAHLYGRGAATLPEVSRWAAPVLAEAQPRPAASALIGSLVSRSFVAAFAASLLPCVGDPTAPTLYPMALALMGLRVLPADAVTRVLRATTAGPPLPLAGLPSIDDIARVRRLSALMGSRRTERLLTDAGTIAGGPALLARTAVLLEGMPTGACLRLPQRLAALHDRCRELTPLDPRPQASVPRRPSRVEPPVVPRQRPRLTALPRQQLVAPPAGGAVARASEHFSYAANVARLHRRAVGFHLRLVLPRSASELRAWGVQHHSCVGSFGAAVACGRSVIVGVERHDVLTYCAELTPASRTLRQFHGPYNRAVPVEVAAAVCEVLFAEGCLDAHHRSNWPWLRASRSGLSS